MALLRHISFSFTTKSYSYFRYLKIFLLANNFSHFPFTSSCIFWLHFNFVVFYSWVNLTDTEYLQNMMSKKRKLMGLLQASRKRGRKAHFFNVFIILMLIRTACWSSSRDNSYLPAILLNVACLWVKTKPPQPIAHQSCYYMACIHISYKTYGSKSKIKYKTLTCLGKSEKC